MADTAGSGCSTLLALTLIAIGVSYCGHRHKAALEQKHEERVAERLEEIRAGTYEEAVGDAGCSGDCEGHEAGWTYARGHDGDLGTACEAPNPATASAFVQGCQTFLNAGDEAEEQVRDEEKGGR